jgi:beta-lactamase regulating signal transducer with metallopeptidase domain
MTLIDLGLRSAVILAVALALTILLRRSSASARHTVWVLAMGGVLIMPVLMLLPGWRVLPAWSTASTQVVPGFSAGSLEQVTKSSEADGAAAAASRALRAPAGLPLVTVWACGAALSLLPMILGWRHLRRVERSCRACTDTKWLRLKEELEGVLGISRDVRLLVGRPGAMPMTWGLWRVRIALPAEAESWREPRMRLILLHELAHVRRQDVLTHTLARAACSLYWFNPLIWHALWRMRIERERACDDLVLAAGAPAPEYARELLALAAFCRAGPSAAWALPAAQPAILERRLGEILDERRDRSTPGGVRVALMALLMAGCALAVSCIQGPAQTKTAATGTVFPQPAGEAGGAPLVLWDAATSHCSYDMRTLVQYAHIYARGHEGRLPPDLGALVTPIQRYTVGFLHERTLEIGDLDDAERARLFLSLRDEERVARPRQLTPEWANRHASYVYLGSEEVLYNELADEWSRIVLFHTHLDHPHVISAVDGTEARVIVLGFMDSHGEVHPIDEARKIIERSRRRLAVVR